MQNEIIALKATSATEFHALWDALAQFVANTEDCEDEMKEELEAGRDVLENTRTLARLEAARKFLEQMDRVAMTGVV